MQGLLRSPALQVQVVPEHGSSFPRSGGHSQVGESCEAANQTGEVEHYRGNPGQGRWVSSGQIWSYQSCCQQFSQAIKKESCVFNSTSQSTGSTDLDSTTDDQIRRRSVWLKLNLYMVPAVILKNQKETPLYLLPTQRPSFQTSDGRLSEGKASKCGR